MSRLILNATTVTVVAFGLSGCGTEPVAPLPQISTLPSSAAVGSPTAPQAPLPAPEALTDVLAKLSDPSVPGDQKVALVQYATPEDGAALARFAQAIVDGGLAPLTFQATDLSWAPADYGDVVATVTIGSANPAPDARPFSYPMQFTPVAGVWQLTRDTADQLLEMQSQTPLPEPPR